MVATSSAGPSYAGSVASSRSSMSRRPRAENISQSGQGDDLLDRRSTLESGIFGVLFTLSKEASETRIRIRWDLLKVLLDAWQLFTTVISPSSQGWDIDPNGSAWKIVGVLNFTWLADLGYRTYLAILYTVLALLVLNVGLCIWVAWCFKEHRFPVVWPIKALRLFSKIFFQAFDVAALNLIQLGISCRYTGAEEPHLHFALFPDYSCVRQPHVTHYIVSAFCLALFVTTALLVNMAEVEVNLLSRRPSALGHSGAEVMAFAVKVLLTLVSAFIGWKRVEACIYLFLSVNLAWLYLRWSPHLLAWVNCLKSGVSVAIVWCSIALMLLVFEPGVQPGEEGRWAGVMTLVMLGGLAPAFLSGALASWAFIRHMTNKALWAIENAKPGVPLKDICQNIDDPRDVEIVARCCRVWKDPYTLDPDAIARARKIIQAGVAMFPNSAYMVLLHGNFMIDVLGIKQSGSRRVEDARKLHPGMMCRFIMFIRQQMATQYAAGAAATGQTSMDLLAYVEYQRKQRMVVRLHREALQAMCNFWKALDASRVSFTYLTKALSKIESSVSQAQTAYRVVLESYGNNPKLVRLYGKFLQTIKNDPWRASEYFQEADRLEEVQNGDSAGPLLPDGTPLGRMDEMATAVLLISAEGEVQMANRRAHALFGYKRGMLDGKPVTLLLAPHYTRRFTEKLASLVSSTALALVMGVGCDEDAGSMDEIVVAMHYDRLAFPVKLALRKASGIGEDSTFIVLIEELPPVRGLASLWVAVNGAVVACDPQFVSIFGWKSSEVNGVSLNTLLSVRSAATETASGDLEAPGITPMRPIESASAMVSRILGASGLPDIPGVSTRNPKGLFGTVIHKYVNEPMQCFVSAVSSESVDVPVHEIRIKLLCSDPPQLLVVNRKGVILHASSDLARTLKDVGANGRSAQISAGDGGLVEPTAWTSALTHDTLSGYTIEDFLPSPWKEMHAKYCKTTTSITPHNRSQWACRQSAGPGPTLDLQSASGKPVFMRTAVSTLDVTGEITHVVRMARSSLEAAVSERRLRLHLSVDGIITSFSAGTPTQLLGMDYSQVVGRDLSELLDWSINNEAGKVPGAGQITFKSLLKKALTHPGHSWRVMVSPLQKPNPGHSELMAAARATMTKPAVIQIHMDLPGYEDDDSPGVYVDLWPLASVTGILELDHNGRIKAVLAEPIRPVGLLFGLPSQNLVGSTLASLVELPPGRSRPADLLTLQGAKKSSLKMNSKDRDTKVGPVHVVKGKHSDGCPLLLEIQLVGKPAPSQPAHAILRAHVAHVLPSATADKVAIGGRAATAAASVEAKAMAVSSIASKTIPTAATKPQACNAAVASRIPGTLYFPPAAPTTAAGPSVAPIVYTSGAVLSASPSTGFCPGLPATMDQAIDRPDQSLGAECSRSDPAGAEAFETLTEESPGEKVASIKSVGLAGQNKLGELVRDMSTSSRDGYLPPAAGMGGSGRSPSRRDITRRPSRMSPMLRTTRRSTLPASGAAQTPSNEDAILAHTKSKPRLVRSGSPRRVTSIPATIESDVEEPDGVMKPGASGPLDASNTFKPDEQASANDSSSDEGMLGVPRAHQTNVKAGAELISNWVASKGAYYQNTSPSSRQQSNNDGNDAQHSDDRLLTDNRPMNIKAILRAGSGLVDDDMDKEGESFETIAVPVSSAIGSSMQELLIGGYKDDDAASEGGQSAVSAQTASDGMEYKRGKRYRKLMKLMDSSQTQQVQHRFRSHALITVSLLAAVHVICFSLAIVSINSLRGSMLQLARSGQSQLYMHQIMTDVRSLDVLGRNNNNPTLLKLYNVSDEWVFINRIGTSADEIQTRLKDILDTHSKEDSSVKDLLFYTQRPVWEGKSSNGSENYANATIWDFATRFYTMAKNIEQHASSWRSKEVHTADTYAGQFLLKSGPDLWRASRKVLDELLYIAARYAEWVNTLQLIFLALEGTAVTCAAAGYLAYLLRALAAQRYKLYGTFLVIPVGLTRALASQNTNLMVDDDEDDEDDEGDDKEAGPDEKDPENMGDGVEAVKQKRRAMLAVSDTAMTDEVSLHQRRPLSRNGTLNGQSAGQLIPGDLRRVSSNKLAPMRSLTVESTESRDVWHIDWWRTGLRRAFNRWSWWALKPLPQSNVDAALNNAAAKRKLKLDSNEAVLLMTPFLTWSALVITIYAVGVLLTKGIVEIVAIHSVSNFMSARTYRAVFFAQELAAETNTSNLAARRSALLDVHKVVKDAWYTLQLGVDAYRAAGPFTERFPLVTNGLAYDSKYLSDIFYGRDQCHRVMGPCRKPDDRYYSLTRGGLDSIMQTFMMNVRSMATNTSDIAPGLGDEYFDLIYNVGSKDLVEGTVKVEIVHNDLIMGRFNRLLVLHVILFLVFWIIFAGFFLFLLNPLLKRIARERRRIAELMSQLPLELDVEKLVARALGSMPTTAAAAVVGAAAVGAGSTTMAGRLMSPIEVSSGTELDGKGAGKWKAIIKSSILLGAYKSAALNNENSTRNRRGS